MIIKSHIRGGFRDAAAYLKDQGKNEYTRLVEMSDPHVKNFDEAFKAMWAVADGTKVKKALHHVSINPMKDERLTDKHVRRICKRLEEKYGYAHGEHQRVIVEHTKDGRQHFHVIWNRVSLKTGKPHYPYMHKKQSKIAAREMEVELGLKKPVSRRKSPKRHIRKRTTVKTLNPRRSRTVIRRPASTFGISSKTQPIIQTGKRTPVLKSVEQTAPIRPGKFISLAAASAMSAEQRADYQAACEGKITWTQYFRKWGNGGLSL